MQASTRSIICRPLALMALLVAGCASWELAGRNLKKDETASGDDFSSPAPSRRLVCNSRAPGSAVHHAECWREQRCSRLLRPRPPPVAAHRNAFQRGLPHAWPSGTSCQGW